jgi:hypothetical protein
MVDANERLQVLLTQEETIYRTSDYLTRMQHDFSAMDADATVPSDDNNELSPGSPNKKRKSLTNSGDTSTGSSSPLQNGEAGHKSGDSNSNSQINKHWREKICEWAYQGKLAHWTCRQACMFRG